MAKYIGWIGSGDGSGIAVMDDAEHTIVRLPRKPELVPKPAGSPAGDFIMKPNIGYKLDKEGNPQPIEGSQFVTEGIPGHPGAREEYIGEVADRRAQLERVMANRLGQRINAKGQVDSENMQWGYTPEQEQQRAALESARNKLIAKFNEGEWTAEQVRQMDEQITMRENAILPQPLKSPPTVQEQFAKSIVTLPSGVKGTVNKNGTFERLDVGVSYKDWNTAVESVREALSVEVKNKDGTSSWTTPTDEEVQAAASASLRAYQEAQGTISGENGGQPLGLGARPRPQLRTRETLQMSPESQKELESMGIMAIQIYKDPKAQPAIQEAVKEGKTVVEAVREIKAMKEGKTATTSLPTWGELDKDQQESVLEKFRREEENKQKPTTRRGFGVVPTRTVPSQYVPQTEEEFIKSVESDPELLHNYIKLKPESWYEATLEEQRMMYEEYRKTVKKGGKIKEFVEFESIMKDKPDKITEYYKVPEKK